MPIDINMAPRGADSEASEEDVSSFNSAMSDAEDPALEVVENEDGSALIRNDGDFDEDDLGSEDFDENLASRLPETTLHALGKDQYDLIDSDRKTQEERDKQYADGIKRTGLGNEAPGGAGFDGASKVVHPMLAKGCIDFASRAIKELYPAGGPCKTQIIGESTDTKLDKAERKKTYMNWQLTRQVEENRAEMERLLSQLPLGGSQYKRWWYDSKYKRPRTEVVYADCVFLPYNQSDFYTSPRVTHLQYVSRSEYEARIDSGLYRDLKLSAPPVGGQDQTEAGKATDKIMGVEEDVGAYNSNGLREVYQEYVELELEEDKHSKGERAPYIMHIDKYSNRVLGLYRNWAESDKTRKRKHWMVEYEFIPWRGGRGVGLAHIIGSMAASATGALRAILDAALIQNFPGAVKLAGGRTAGTSVQVNPTEITEVQAPPGVDDIRKLMMAFPFPGPSAVLYNVLEWLTQQAEVVVATASEKIADGGANMPMGTALALIEHGSVNFSAIHSRMHASLARELQILHRINMDYLDDEEVVEDLGELVVSHEDFEGPMDVIPVSDPNIFSEAQRYAQLQAVMQLRGDPQFASYFKPDRLLQRALKLLQFPAPEDIANLPKDPQRGDPIIENYWAASTEPRPLKVYLDQDDVAHLESHLHFMLSPLFGASPLFSSQALPVLLQHCKEHMIEFYRKHAQAAASASRIALQLSRIPASEEQILAHGAAFADKVMAQILSPLVAPGLQQAFQLVQQAMQSNLPPPSPDVRATLASNEKVKQMEFAYRNSNDQADRAANAQASQMAVLSEKIQAISNQNEAELAARQNVFKEFMNNVRTSMTQQMQTDREAFLEVLKQSLAGQMVPPEAIAQQVQATLQDMLANQFQGRGNNVLVEAVLQMLEQRLPALTTQQSGGAGQLGQAAPQQAAAPQPPMSPQQIMQGATGAPGSQNAGPGAPGGLS